MTHRPSKDFEKRFWHKFDQEFGRETSLFKRFLIPSVVSICLLVIFVMNHRSLPRYDPVAIQIAIDVDESLGQIIDQPSFSSDEDWLEFDQFI